MLDQLALSDDTIPVMSQISEQAKFKGRQLDSPSVDHHSEAPRIDAQGTNFNERGDMAPDATQQGSQSGEEFLHFEGFCQIVVGTGIDPLNPLQPGASGRQNENWDGAGLFPQSPHHGQAIELRQTKVEDESIVIFRGGSEPALLPVSNDIHDVSGLGQSVPDVSGDCGLILDEKNPHQRLLIWRI